MNSKLVTPSKNHRTINSAVLAAARERTGLSQEAFAKECGHTQQYQQQLESPGIHEIPTQKAEEILSFLKKYK